MTAASLALLVMAWYGLTFMQQFATIFDIPRNLLRGGEPYDAELDEGTPYSERNFVQRFFYDLFDCAFCLGTWSGIEMWAMHQLLSPHIMELVVWALASASVGLFGYLLTRKLS